MSVPTLVPDRVIIEPHHDLPWPRRTGRQEKPRRQPFRVGDFWLRVFNFETRRVHESPVDPPRTVGQTCWMLRRGPERSIGEAEAVTVCLRVARPASEMAAKEKIVFCDEAGGTRVYQADRQNRSAALCACGNATGASAAMLAQLANDQPEQQVSQIVELPDGKVEVQAGIRRLDNGTWRVEQTWRGIQFRAQAARLARYDVVICTGTLNEYVIVRLPDRGALDAFALSDALSLWREARPFGFANPLQSRLVAVAPIGARPAAKFFTCGRNHPGAPLTGLATLALASAHSQWLALLLNVGEIDHPRGSDFLPVVRDAGVEFAPINVALSEGDSAV